MRVYRALRRANSGAGNDLDWDIAAIPYGCGERRLPTTFRSFSSRMCYPKSSRTDPFNKRVLKRFIVGHLG